MKIILKILIALLLIPPIAFYGLFLYGVYLKHSAEEYKEKLDTSLTERSTSGNGYGGEAGFSVMDSGFYALNKFFWIDDVNLVFVDDSAANVKSTGRTTYVWNTEKNTTKPLDVGGVVNCFLDNKLYFYKAPKTERPSTGRVRKEVYEAALTELNDSSWLVDGEVRVADVIPAPPEGYEMVWTDQCRPRFWLRSHLRTADDFASHHLTYLPEWGWILRLPADGYEHAAGRQPPMGFFDIDGAVYSGQLGREIVGLNESLGADAKYISMVYIDFMHKYWVASRSYGEPSTRRVLGILNRQGQFHEIAWPSDWPDYSGIPLPTKKGLFWSGYDYRLSKRTRFDKGVFLRDKFDVLHKVIHGTALNSKMSKDGCKIAFFNTPRDDKRSTASLKVFNACTSLLNGKELENVDY